MTKEVYRVIEHTALTMGYTSMNDYLINQLKTNCPADWLSSIFDEAIQSSEISRPLFFRNGYIYDPWNNLINIARHSSMTMEADGRLQQTPVELIIWSSGGNGRNDFGHGDEIILVYSNLFYKRLTSAKRVNNE